MDKLPMFLYLQLKENLQWHFFLSCLVKQSIVWFISRQRNNLEVNSLHSNSAISGDFFKIATGRSPVITAWTIRMSLGTTIIPHTHTHTH